MSCKVIKFTFLILLLLLNAGRLVSAQEEVTLRLKWRHQFQFAGYYAAQYKGYYESAGLKVNIKEKEEDREPVDELLAGETEFAVADSSVSLLYFTGKPVQILASIFQHSPLVLIASKKSGVTHPVHMRGKTFRSAWGVDDAPVQAMLLEAGLKKADMQVRPQKFGWDELLNGEVDALVAYITDAPYELKRRGFEFQVLNPRDYGIDFYGDNLISRSDFIYKNPRLVQSFVRESLRGWQYAMSNPEEVVDWIAANLESPLDKEALLYEAQAMQGLILPNLVEVGHTSPNRFGRIQKLYQDMGLQTGNRDLEGLIYDPLTVEFGKEKIIGITVTLLMLLLALIYGYSMRRKLMAKIIASRRSAQEVQTSFVDALKRSPLTMCITSLETGEFLDCNESYLEMTGYERSEIIGKTSTDVGILEPEFRTKMRDKLVTEGSLRGEEGYFRCKSGEKRLGRAFGSMVKYRGEVVLLGLYEDIHDAFEEKVRLANEKELLDSITKIQGRLIKGHAPEGLFDFLLKELLHVTGSEFGFIGDVLHEEDGTPFLQTHAISDISWDEQSRNFLLEHGPAGLEFRNLDTLFGRPLQSGEALISNSPNEDERAGGLPPGHPELKSFAGMPIYYGDSMVAMAGVANREEGYDEELVSFLEPFLRTMGQVVHFYRQELERQKIQRELVIAKEEAELASSAKTRFLATMSHEIRTPLNAIVGVADLLRNTSLDEEQLNLVETYDRASEHLLSLVNDILDISKVEAGELQIDLCWFDLRKLVEDCIHLHESKARQKGLRLVFEAKNDSVVKVCSDDNRIRQVLVNLLSNAIKFTSDGLIRVALELEGEEVKLEVSDTGKGIEMSSLERIFDPFSQEDEGIQRHYGGTGLGLAICKKIAYLLKGELLVSSTPKEGSVFSFVFKRNAFDREEEDLKPTDAVSMEELIRKPMNVLAVDDAPDNLMILEHIFKKTEDSLTLCSSASEALEICKANSFDLILMDLHMPGESGDRALAKISELEASESRINSYKVILTADALKEQRELCLSSGAHEVLTKPIRKKRVLQLLDESAQKLAQFN